MSRTFQGFEQALAAIDTDSHRPTLAGIQRGVERECLRVQPSGRLSQRPHPVALGSALTHDTITTDFSEALLEFITPPERDASRTLAELTDIHKFSLSRLDDECFWPLSMPCYVDNENEIPLAYYGESNIGKMKRVYRLGLKNRYGSMMQAIAGVHFNFSLPEHFWRSWADVLGEPYSVDFVSAQYFSLIRNYRRYCWVIPYLFGASPALCESFLKGKPHNLNFSRLGKGTLYLPYATSLRMSDLGYTNAEQSALQICYNHLDTYVAKLREAMTTPSQRYAHFSAGEEGIFQQLSKNILQIENELYSPIRPKQPTRSMEKPTDALVTRGVSYIEVRALDVNPFAPAGIDLTQMAFLDAFLVTCLLMPSPPLDAAGLQESTHNLTRVVLEGRSPTLSLMREGQPIPLRTWAGEFFAQLTQTAALLDKAMGSHTHSSAVAEQQTCIDAPELTLSGRLLNTLLSRNIDNGVLGMELAQQYKQHFQNADYNIFHDAHFERMAQVSLEGQRDIEAREEPPFADFIREYYAAEQAKKMPSQS